ncbi:MAG: SDR family NAD(P)-dependent oxidoreductase [Anaerolineae bacterium]|nr:SDR family NAD(P)-dependent oxidoreductase [Anaerolineae bacterium]MCX8067074.1 SDR family NAD(P)-dependent oxidoreductase [Anaerolineae bacterium]MDW7990948.1 SDR family NAD(P)-dependent oxidoreductase [Anaerolineae bacterium]
MANVLIWGASGGIGRALTETFLTKGHTVGAVARRPEGLEALTPFVFPCDVTDPEGVSTVAVRAAEAIGPLDVFIYAVGDILSAKVAEMTPEDWRRILDANLTGVYLTVRATLPHLAPKAHLFFLGAQHERLRLPGLGAYAAAKAGLEALAEVVRKESRRKVTVVRPGAVTTPLWEKVPFRIPAHALSPQQVAEAIFQAWEEGREGVLDL